MKDQPLITEIPARNILKMVVILSIICTLDGLAQRGASVQSNARTAGSVEYLFIMDEYITPREYDIEGTPYYQEEYVNGDLYSSLGPMHDLRMRYNIYFDRMEYMTGDILNVIVPHLAISKVQLGDETFTVETLEDKEGTYLTFLIRLDSGGMSLLTKMEIIFKDRQQGKPIQGDIPAQYQRMPDKYYFRLQDGSLERITSMKKVLQWLPDRKKEMEEFVKEHKISAKNTEELIAFTQYYNSLE